jgi:alpha-N-arabinofuranosidase
LFPELPPLPRARITVLADEPPIGLIRPELHGHFAEHLGGCVEDGIWVGEDSSIPNVHGYRSDVLDALKRIRVPVIRWPGGCYADDYHWEDGVGPRKDRPRRVNVWWGHNAENNCFGTHEFIGLCRHLGAEPYLAGNVGSGTPRELRDWMEYCNFAGDSTLARSRAGNGSPQPFGVRYWGVGNENWGCGGNFCPEDYAREFKRFATYLGPFGGTQPYLIACGPDGNDADWTRRFLTKHFSTRQDRYGAGRLSALAAHYYCGTAGPSATEFDTHQWYELLDKALRMDELITTQRSLIDSFDPHGRRIGLVIDEWGTWHLPTAGASALWQQSTLRDGLVAAITLDVFHRHADKLAMCNIAQLANVLQSLVLTQGERMVLTPTYHVFHMYSSHQGGQSLRVEAESSPVKYALGNERREMPGLFGSASTRGGAMTLSVVNPHATLPVEADVELRGYTPRHATVMVLRHDELNVHNTFDEPAALRPEAREIEVDAATWRHVFAPASVTVLRLT